MNLSKLKPLYEILKTILIIVSIAFLIRYFIIQPFVVEGSSMQPSLSDGDYILIDKITYRAATPKRGEVIVFKFPQNPKLNFIKRIIGLPGEKVEVNSEGVFINGIKLVEDYTNVPKEKVSPLTIQLNENQFFVMGDNRDHSSDSRSWGPLPKINILGKVVLVVLPFKDFETIHHPDYFLENSGS